MRAACDYYGKNELDYGKDNTNQSELDQFYLRYQAYKRESTPKK